jgi:hypothetical protein
MYLSGAITFRKQDQSTVQVNTIPALANALSQGWLPMRPGNVAAYDRSSILGGELFDGCPANVIFSDGQWTPDQLTAIRTDPSVRAAVGGCRYLPAEFRTAQAVALTTPNGSQGAPLSVSYAPRQSGSSGGGVVTNVLLPPPTDEPAPQQVLTAGVGDNGMGLVIAAMAGLFFLFSGGSKRRR